MFTQRLSVRRLARFVSLTATLCALFCSLGAQAQNKAAPVSSPPATRGGISAQGQTFDDAVASLFNAYTVNGVPQRYRIDPAVTAYLDPVTYAVQDASLDTALTTLLDALRESKMPLTFHVEKGVYVITPKETVKSGAAVEPVGLPSYHPAPVIKNVTVTNERPAAALRKLFEQAGVSYIFIQPFGTTATPHITLTLHDLPLEQAVVRVLRSAPAEPMLYLNRVENSLEPGKFVYTVSPFPRRIQSAPAAVDLRYSYHLKGVNLYDILKMVLAADNKNYTIDPTLRTQKVTAIGEDLIMEDALARLVATAPKPLMVKVDNGIYSIVPK